MVDYRIIIDHKDKGIGFCAKEALRAPLKQPTSPITKVNFYSLGSDRSELVVGLADDQNELYLRRVLENSGRMPSQPGVWEIVRIGRVGDEQEAAEDESEPQSSTLQTRMKALEEGHQTAIDQLTTENQTLQQKLERAQLRVTNSPLEGLLSYFASLDYSTTAVVDNALDAGFMKEVLNGRLENTFPNYFNYAESSTITPEELDHILAFDYSVRSQELDQFRKQVAEAEAELHYLQQIESGAVAVPDGIKQSIIGLITTRKPEETIEQYAQLSSQVEGDHDRKQKAERLQKRYGAFAEQMNLLQGASQNLPVIFDFLDDPAVLYFPFSSRSVKAGFAEDLQEELRQRFSPSIVKKTEHQFLAYQVSEPRTAHNFIGRLKADLPFTLRISGFNRIVPYQLGESF